MLSTQCILYTLSTCKTQPVIDHCCTYTNDDGHFIDITICQPLFTALSATTVLSSVEKSCFMNMHEAGETNLLPITSHFTIKYSSITMPAYWDFLT